MYDSLFVFPRATYYWMWLLIKKTYGDSQSIWWKNMPIEIAVSSAKRNDPISSSGTVNKLAILFNPASQTVIKPAKIIPMKVIRKLEMTLFIFLSASDNDDAFWRAFHYFNMCLKNFAQCYSESLLHFFNKQLLLCIINSDFNVHFEYSACCK